MDNWENIKEALKLTGGKYVLAEKGEPSYVVVELGEYVDLLKRSKGKKNNPGSAAAVSPELKNLSERGLIEKINGNINVWKDLQDKRIIRKMKIGDAMINSAAEREKENNFESEDSGKEKIVIEEI